MGPYSYIEPWESMTSGLLGLCSRFSNNFNILLQSILGMYISHKEQNLNSYGDPLLDPRPGLCKNAIYWIVIA